MTVSIQRWKNVRAILIVGLVLSFVAILFLDVTNSLAGDSAPTTQPASNSKSRLLKVMSFNIRNGAAQDGKNHWKHRHKLVFDVIQKYEPDIIGLQEVLHDQLEELKKALPQYDTFGVGRDDGKKRGEYASIFYNRERFERLDGGTFWFSDTPEEICSTSWGNSLCRICTWAKFRDKNSSETFHHFNVHLDHQSAPSRLESAKLVINRINRRDPIDPVILTGDFNAGENSPSIRSIKDSMVSLKSGADAKMVSMIDTYRIAKPNEKDVGTFCSFVGDTKGNKIDYIFIPEGSFDVMNADIAHDHFDGRYPSDHFPIWATLRFK